MEKQLFEEAVKAVRNHKNANISNREEYEKSYKATREVVEKYAEFVGMEYEKAARFVAEIA